MKMRKVFVSAFAAALGTALASGFAGATDTIALPVLHLPATGECSDTRTTAARERVAAHLLSTSRDVVALAISVPPFEPNVEAMLVSTAIDERTPTMISFPDGQDRTLMFSYLSGGAHRIVIAAVVKVFGQPARQIDAFPLCFTVR